MRKIISWNVNGIRALAKRGFLEWLSEESPDILCLQEVKANEEDIDEVLRAPFGYKSHWASAQKKGYSGVAIFAKADPVSMTRGIGLPRFDSEGRALVADYGEFTLINAYFPNSQRDHARLSYKLDFCDAMLNYCEGLIAKKKNLILCGDFNIAHKEIDLANPKTNVDNAGFLPEERAWLDKYVGHGYIDVFRHFCKDPGQYTWWSYRPGVREKNIGWRLDYHFVNKNFLAQINGCRILSDVLGSDHCPVVVEVKV